MDAGLVTDEFCLRRLTCNDLHRSRSILWNRIGIVLVPTVSRLQVLCASDDAHGKVEPVLVPDEVLIGERLFVEG